MTDDWRKPYHSLDEGGSPETCRAEAERWIEERADAAFKRYKGRGLSLDYGQMIGGGGVIVLYHEARPIAVATIFRTPMNRSTLVRWVAPE